MTGGLKVAFFYWRKNMRELWNMLQAMFTGIGGWLGYFLGGCDGLLYALIAFTVIDYISGVMCGIVDNNLSSSIGFKGICRLCESSYNLHYTNSIFMRIFASKMFLIPRNH